MANVKSSQELRLDWIMLPNCKEISTNSKKLCIGESSRSPRTSLTGLSALWHNEMFVRLPLLPRDYLGILAVVSVCVPSSFANS